MAYVVLVGEGEAAGVMEGLWREKSKRLRTHTRTAGALVLYDTNLAREFVRDVKGRLAGGKLVVFNCADPHEVIESGGVA